MEGQMGQHLPSHLESFTLISSFTVYYLTERVLRSLVTRYIHSPTFRDALKVSRKDSVYFGILLGAIISLFSFPFCANAVREYQPLSSQIPKGFNGRLSMSAEVCITSRAVLWVSELNRLDMYPMYIYHHLGSIAMFLSTLFLQTPQLLFIPFASLVTEVTGDFVWILSAHRDLDSRRSERLERVKQAVQNINIWVYSLRIPSIPAIMYSAIVTARLGREERGDLWATVLIAWTIFVLTMYSIWIGLYLFRQVQSSQSHSCHVDVPENEKSRHDDAPQEEEAGVCLENPIHVRFRNGLILTLYGPLMGLGLSMLALVSFLLSPAIESFKPLSLSLLITLALAILFARLLSLIFEDTLSAFFRNPVKVLLRPGFWLQGGLLGAGLGIVLSSMLGLVPDILNFAAGLGIALPLYEFVSRLGCHTYGCCYGKPVSKDSIIPPVVYTSEFAAAVRLNPALRYVPLFPIQLISSVLFFLQFVIIWILAMHCHVVDIIEAAGISFAVHSIIRLWTERFRSDFRGKEVAVSLGKQRMALSVTARIAVLQLIFGVTMAAYRLPYGRTFEPSNVAYDQVQLLEILGDEWVWSCLLLVFFVGTAVYGLHRNRIGRGIVG